MSRIIAGLYEIEEEIGSGGGGIVYLGKHVRLRKKVVLKADKRSLTTEESSLRREVDFLKELSHTYIPQVYDYVQEDGIVYTVMDYIEGESLDKILKRKECPTQPQIIQWSCQLLEALSYLHNQKPHGILHGDIKPANIMLRNNGDVCLIDFNIALALGEDGAVKVGYSRGYASPEHYGLSYISENRPAAIGKFTFSKEIKRNSELKNIISKRREKENLDSKDCRKTESIFEDAKTELLSQNVDTETIKLSLEESENDRTELLFQKTDYKFIEDNRTELLIEENKSPNVQNQTAQPSLNNGSSTKSSDGIMLDARSDIYSLGATLYHLISGKRPSQDADKVIPLGKEVCSPAVAAIIQKAMAPDPTMRYQSAEEMLRDFLELYKNDERIISLKRHSKWMAVMLSLLFGVGMGCVFQGLQQKEILQEAKVLAGDSINALETGDVNEAVRLALEGANKENGIMGTVSPSIQRALTDSLGVYRVSGGFQARDIIETSAVPFDVVLSPNGSYLAITYAYEVVVYRADELKKIKSFPMHESALADVLFVNETQIIYAGLDGITAYDLQKEQIMWKADKAETLAISGNGKVVASVNRKDKKAVIYNALTGEKISECSFGEKQMWSVFNNIFADPKKDIFALNQNGTMLAASFGDGSLIVFDIQNPENSIQVLDETKNTTFTGGFCGKYFGFTAQGTGNSMMQIINTEDASYIAEYESVDDLLLQINEQGIYLADGNLLVSINPEDMTQKELAYVEGNIITGFEVDHENIMISTEDQGFSFYKNGQRISKEICDEHCDFLALGGKNAVVANRNQNIIRVLHEKEDSETIFLSYDLGFTHDEVRISHDKERMMFFNYQEFAICDREGNVIYKDKFPNAERIYDQQFRRESNQSYLEVIWYDGTVRYYNAWDGTLMVEYQEDLPDKSLREEFYTDKYKIVSELHTAPKVFELGKETAVVTLEEDGYLTYVTQVGENILTEYISTSGMRYGVMLNNNLEKIAVLPDLCDVWEDILLFDNGTGIVRHSRLYSSQELMNLGEQYLENAKEEK